jgi:hypothetical protein
VVGKEEIHLRPLAVLLGIAVGSTGSLFVGLSLTAIVFLLLPEYQDRFSGEWRPLLTGIALTSVLTAIAAASFIGELRAWRSRHVMQCLLALAIGLVLWRYWP